MILASASAKEERISASVLYQRMSFERMGSEGDGDLSAVVWGVTSSRSPSIISHHFQANQSPTVLLPPSSFSRSVYQKSMPSCATIDTSRVTNTSDSSSCASFLPQRTLSSSSLTITSSLDRSTGTLSEVARMFASNRNNPAPAIAYSDTLTTNPAHSLSDKRSSLYSDTIQGWSAPQGGRSTSSHDIAGAISSMINESLQFGSSELLHCQSPTSVEGPAMAGIAHLSSAEDSALSTSMMGKKLNLSAYSMPNQRSSVSPPRAQKTAVCKQVSKRRKMQQKRIVCVPISGDGRPSGEILPSDMWAWRKYGQKPIKGSPYPRGYYRCSSSKGCSARKQVERSQTDPSMLILTYTSEHNHSWPAHRNSLAGTTRPRSSPEKSFSASPAEMASHSSDALSASIMTADNSETHLIADSGQDQGSLAAISTCSSQEEEFFPDLEDGLLKDSCALRRDFLEDERSDDEGGNVEVDPYNLFCW